MRKIPNLLKIQENFAENTSLYYYYYFLNKRRRVFSCSQAIYGKASKSLSAFCYKLDFVYIKSLLSCSKAFLCRIYIQFCAMSQTMNPLLLSLHEIYRITIKNGTLLLILNTIKVQVFSATQKNVKKNC